VITETLRAAGSVRVIGAGQLTAADVDNIDLLVAGSPTHVANLPRELRRVLEAMPKRVLKGVAVAAFDASYKMNGFVSMFTAAKPLGRKLRRLGGKQIVPPKSFFVVEKQGPLYDGELERAEGWAATILAKVQAAAQNRRIRRT